MLLPPLATPASWNALASSGLAHAKPNSAAVGVCRRLAVDRRGDAEHPSLRAIKDAALRIRLARRQPDGAQYRVVELLGGGKIIGADHYVCEHALLSVCQSPIRTSPGPRLPLRSVSSN